MRGCRLAHIIAVTDAACGEPPFAVPLRSPAKGLC
jgi:hypothetical protein